MTAAPALGPAPITRQQTLRLGMAQLGFRGLSEDWWLRHLGDVHWQLIADAVGQRTTVFRDTKGRQIYAAFCATEFEQFTPDAAQLGGDLSLTSALWSAGKSRLQSNHSIHCEDVELARFRLISTFVAHQKAGINASVSRAAPALLPVLPPSPGSFAAETSQTAKAQRHVPPPDRTTTLHPNTGTDFNAVGLLYFPSYTRLFEQAEAALTPPHDWSPVLRRRVTYFANVEPGDAISAGGRTGAFGLWCQSGTRKLAHCDLTRVQGIRR